MKSTQIVRYHPTEEKINVYTHAVGIVLSVVALFFLVDRALYYGGTLHVVAYIVYGLSQISIFTASTLYHSSTNDVARHRLNIFDHSAIYLSIAGTYTPFTLLAMQGVWGWSVFAVVWTIALAGITLKIFFTGRFKLASTISYVAMGWIIVIALKPLIASLPFAGLMWLAAGGLLYTSGAVIYQIKKIKFNHAIFHFVVLAAAICHFISVYFYTI